MITCREFVEFLDRYVEDDLTEIERATFEEHMSDCSPCVDFLESYRKTTSLCREAFGDPEAPLACPEVPDELVRAILEAKRR